MLSRNHLHKTKIFRRNLVKNTPPVEKTEIPEEKLPEITTTLQVPGAEPKIEVKPDASRCSTCNRKLGMYGFNCKCGFFYCKKHRLPEEHECGFDFNADGKRKLSDQNPEVKSSKIIEF